MSQDDGRILGQSKELLVGSFPKGDVGRRFVPSIEQVENFVMLQEEDILLQVT